jgi:hypothetical protein
MAAFASLMQGGIRYGKAVYVKSTATTVQPGLLVAQDSSGSNSSGSVTVGLAAATGDCMGIAYGGRHSTYRPTTKVFSPNEPITVVNGQGIIGLSSDFFTGGSFPVALPAPLYQGASGLWNTSGTLRVGRALEVVQAPSAVAGTGLQVPYCIVQFNIV